MGVFAEIPAPQQIFRRPPSVSGTGAGRPGAKKGSLKWEKTAFKPPVADSYPAATVMPVIPCISANHAWQEYF